MSIFTLFVENDTILTELGHWIIPLERIIKLDVNAVTILVEFIRR